MSKTLSAKNYPENKEEKLQKSLQNISKSF